MSPLKGYITLARWQFLQAATYLPVIVVLQMVVGAGTVVGMSFLLPDLDGERAAYLATGAPTIGLIVLGLAAVPQSVSQARTSGLYDYFQAQPVGRLAYLVAEMTVLLLIAIPGAAAALLVAALRFDVNLQLGAATPAIAVLVAFTATAVGYVIALAVRVPAVVGLVSNVVLFGTLFFSPINFPAAHLPEWLQHIHAVLPVQHMAAAMRGSLLGGEVLRPIAAMAAWAAVTTSAALLIGTRTR